MAGMAKGQGLFSENMKRVIKLSGCIVLVMSPLFCSLAQTATWIGAVDNRWRTGANWSTGVEPDLNTDVIINFVIDGGPANFQCTLVSGAGVGSCKSLTIGTGANATVFTENDGLFVYGDLTIGANGTFTDTGGHLRVEGDWINDGVYTAGSVNRRVYFIGAAQSITGSTTTTFEKLYINSGSTVTLAQNVVISNFIELHGILDPTPSFFVTVGVNDINIRAGGELRVKASTYAGNYSAGSANSATNTSVINYASTTVNQTVDPSETYDILTISGGMTKSLSANTTVTRDLIINGGTLDLQTFTANRSTAGGSLTMAATTTLRIGGTITFPSNYTSVLLATNSLVEYYGANQTVSSQSYGNLTLSATGTATKTMPGTAFSVAGNFTSSTSAGTLSYTAGNNISVGGNINIGASTVFTSTAFSHSLAGNWINSGTFSGCGSTLTSTGAGSSWSGTGVNNFGNLVITGSGTILNLNTSISLCGNFSTSGGGSFTHTTGGTGTFTMTGGGTTISGSSIILDDLVIGGGGSVSTASTLTVAGDLTATGALTATAGTVSLTGTAKSIAGAGALQFFTLNVPGSISTARNLSISSNFSVAGSYTASAGTTTFNGTSTLSGTTNLFDVNIAAANSLTMGSLATLGIASAVTLVGTFNATLNVPNTVNYNGSGAQALVLTTFNNLIVSNGNTKTPPSGLTINGDFTIGAGTTFDASTFSHSVGGNWTNSGTFTEGTSTVTFTGNADATLTGATTFNNLTINKGAANKVTLNDNAIAFNVDVNAGSLHTGSNSVTINNNRTGNGIILGTITRNLAAFAESVNYAFEGPNNFINFGALSITGTITSITVTVTVGPVVSFAAASCMNRQYSISMLGGTSSNATMRLHYEQNEVNGNAEAASTFWRNVGSWVDQTNANTSSDVLNNWVEKTSITNISTSALWTLSEGLIKFTWTGATSTAWGLNTNWTPVGVPAITDVVHLGDVAFTNQPIISPAALCKKIYFDSVTPTTLTLSGGGSLTVLGNIDGIWSADAMHIINIGTGSLTTFGDVVLSAGVANRKINLNASTGIFNVTGSLTQTGGADIIFTGAGNLNIGQDYNYVSGTFTPSTGKVTYNGLNSQEVAGLTYYSLGFDKTGGDANINSLTSVTNDLTTVTGGQINVDATLNVTRDVSIGASTTLNVPNTAVISVGRDWLLSGTFVPGSGTVNFNGGADQTVNATTFNDLTINKAGGTLFVLANLGVNGNIDVQAGTVDASTFVVTRGVVGGVASLGATSYAKFGGAGFQLVNFASLVANATSTIEFYGGSSRPIPPVTYGHLIITDGGTKTMVGPTTAAGNLTINTGATLAIPATTLTLLGNIVNSGTLDGTPGSLILDGTPAKTITGGFTVRELIVNGVYTVLSGNLTIDDNVEVSTTGNFSAGATTTTIHGDLTNSGILFSSGITTFTGLKVQTIQLNAAISSTSTGVVNFNGTIAPVFNSTSSPTLATVNVNNTAPLNPSQPWTVDVFMNVAAGATWNGGSLNHIMGGHFVNNGTVTSDGTISFLPNPAFPSVNIILGNNFTTTGNVIFGSTAPIVLVDNTPVFASVEINNTNAAGVTAATDWIVSQDLFIGPGAEFKGGTGLTHRVSGDWTNNGTFTGGTSSVIFDSNVGTDEITGGGVNNFYNITFDPATDMAASADIAVSQDFTNNAATLDLLNSEVTFNGSALSLLGGATVSNFDELVIDKSSNGLRMDINATIATALTLTNGELNLNANTLSVTNPVPAAIVRTSGYVLSENTSYNSVLSWTIGTDASAHVFPFGNVAANYIPFTFDLSTGDAGTVSLATYPTAANNLPLPPGVTHVQDQFGADNSANTVDRFWSISLAGETTPNADITLEASASEVGTITTLLGQRWNGTFWDAPLPGQTSNPTSAVVPGVTQFSTWAMSGNNVPLPITLVSFKGQQIDNRVELEWVTASEIDNDFFEIEKSLDGSNFSVIGKVNGAINSTETRVYRFSDFELKPGRFFYRLKQVDLDKKFTYSYIVTVNINEFSNANVELNVFPNPSVSTLFISHAGLVNENVIITLFDPAGKVLMKNEAFISLDINPLELNVMELNPGAYVVQIIYGNGTQSFRIVRSN